jgi:rubrerythrin|tara:strand:- start:61 stop:543 length:483 start_codon:yes stop_codon:yes gene_type:complete
MEATVQLLKTALSHEFKTMAFYSQAAEITKNDESRMLFLELSDMESDHIKHLIEKAKGVSWPEHFDPETYLKDLESSVDETLSIEETETLKNGDMKAVLELSMEIEEETQKTFQELVEKSASQEIKEHSKELAEEEKKQINSLKSLLSSLEMDEEDRSAL